MSPTLVFWSAALANLAAIVGCGAFGIRAVKRGDVRRHRACMVACALLVGVFLGAYALKVAFLGREDRSAWTSLDYAVLYTHELCIAVIGVFQIAQHVRHLAAGEDTLVACLGVGVEALVDDPVAV